MPDSDLSTDSSKNLESQSKPTTANTPNKPLRVFATDNQNGKNPQIDQLPEGVKNAASLGIIAKFVTPPQFEGRFTKNAKNDFTETPKGRASTAELVTRRFVRQAEARRLMPKHRVADCTRALVPTRDHVEVHGGARAHFRGLVTCGAVWCCPVCSARITEARRRELTEAVNNSGLYAVMVTATIKHDRFMRLDDSMRGLLDAWRRVQNGAPYQRQAERYGIRHTVKALENTTSRENGWHPHIHVLMLMDAPLGSDDLGLMQDWFKKRWLAMLAKQGHKASYEHGLNVVAGNDALALYVAKFGHEPAEPERYAAIEGQWTVAHELTKANLKAGRVDAKGIVHYTPFELLDLSSTGDDWARARWCEYVDATHGVQYLRWSRGAKAALGVDELTDEQLAATPDETRLFAELERREWFMILRANKRLKPYGLDIRALMLNCARELDLVAFDALIGAALAIAEELMQAYDAAIQAAIKAGRVVSLRDPDASHELDLDKSIMGRPVFRDRPKRE